MTIWWAAYAFSNPSFVLLHAYYTSNGFCFAHARPVIIVLRTYRIVRIFRAESRAFPFDRSDKTHRFDFFRFIIYYSIISTVQLLSILMYDLSNCGWYSYVWDDDNQPSSHFCHLYTYSKLTLFSVYTRLILIDGKQLAYQRLFACYFPHLKVSLLFPRSINGDFPKSVKAPWALFLAKRKHFFFLSIHHSFKQANVCWFTHSLNEHNTNWLSIFPFIHLTLCKQNLTLLETF